MFVHFIGGPAHGRSEAIQNPHVIYRMAELKRLPIFAALEFEGEYTIPGTDIVEHEYRIIHRTPRYAVAEWQAPPVDVRFEVRLEIDPFDHEGSEALRRFFLERRSELKHGVMCVGVAVTNAIEADLTLSVRVEGPEDPIAIQLAAEKVQHYLDAELPSCTQRIRQAAATT